jgi:multiple sugar transport system substrate-binding protein
LVAAQKGIYLEYKHITGIGDFIMRMLKWFVLIFLVMLVIGNPKESRLLALETTEIRFLTWKPNQPEVWKELIQEFQKKNPLIRVHLQVGPHSSTAYHAIVTQRLKNRDPSVDIFFMDVIWPPEFSNAGWALDLTPRFNKQEQMKFLPGPIRANTHLGKIYGVPCYLASGIFYFRKDLLGKYDLNPPDTWGQMISQGKRIHKNENDPGLYTYSAQFKQYEGLVCNMLEFIWSNGGAVLDSESGRSFLADTAALEAVAFVRDQVVGKAAPKGALNYEEPESITLFIQGKAIFHRNWPYAWAVANDPKKSKVAGKVGVGNLPRFSGHSSFSTLGGWQFGISRWSQNEEAAWKFVSFMTSYQGQKILALKAGLAPTRRAVYHDPEVMDKMPHLKSFLPVFENAKPRPLSPVYPMISQELQRFFSKAITEKGANLADLVKTSSVKIEKFHQLGASINP